MALATEPSQAEQEWAKLLSLSQNPARLNLWDGFAAFDAALERGNLAAARHIANETLAMARQRSTPKAGFFSRWLKSTDSKADLQALRDLSVSLDNAGQVEAVLGNLEPARAAFRKSLELRCQLRQAFPNHVQFKQDLEWIEARWKEFVSQHGV